MVVRRIGSFVSIFVVVFAVFIVFATIVATGYVWFGRSDRMIIVVVIVLFATLCGFLPAEAGFGALWVRCVVLDWIPGCAASLA